VHGHDKTCLFYWRVSIAFAPQVSARFNSERLENDGSYSPFAPTAHAKTGEFQHNFSKHPKEHTMVTPHRTILVVSIFSSCLLLSGCTQKVNDDRVAKKLGMNKESVLALRRSAGSSPRSLLQLAPTQLRDTIRESKYPDLPLARVHFEQLLQRGEAGAIPLGARMRAFQRLDKLKQFVSSRRFAVAGVPVSANPRLPFTAGIKPDKTKWSPLGPTEVGGRTRSIIFNPQNPQEMWIGSIAGGIWHSTDGGVNFSVVNDFMANLVVSTLLVDTKNPSLIFAGTGEGFTNNDALRGAGIFKMENSTWTQISETANDHFLYVNRLAESPDGKILLAATHDGIFVSTDAAHTKWSDVPALSANIADVVFHPSDSRFAIAGGMDTGDTYYSEDGGVSWHKSVHQGEWIHIWPDTNNDNTRRTTPSRAEVTYSAADPKVVYASVDNNNGEIWRSNDSGKNFSKMDSSVPDGPLAYYLGDQGWYDNSIWAGDPKDPDLVIVGGVDLWRSTNGGTSLSPISNWQAQDNVLHADQHAIVSPPIAGSSAVFVGNDGGLFKTDNIRTAGNDSLNISGWTKIGHKYAVTQFYGAAWSPKSGMLIGGAQDNGTLRLAKEGKPENWSELFGGDGGYCAADPSDANYLYGEYVFLDLFRSSDGGQNAEEISGQFWDAADKQFHWKQPPYVIPDAQAFSANFIAPFVLDPSNPNTIIAGGASLWRTDDARTPNDAAKGPSWRSIKPPGKDLISSIAIASQDSKIVWVGYNNGDLFVTANSNSASPSWKQFGGASHGAPARIITKIVIDPSDRNAVYLTYGGYSDAGNRDNVWKVSNGGRIWTNLSASLPSTPAFTLTINPRNRNYLYLGTAIGLFASEDKGAHWSPTNEGPTNAAVMDFVWMGTRLVAVTHGRSMFYIDLDIP